MENILKQILSKLESIDNQIQNSDIKISKLEQSNDKILNNIQLALEGIELNEETNKSEHQLIKNIIKEEMDTIKLVVKDISTETNEEISKLKDRFSTI